MRTECDGLVLKFDTRFANIGVKIKLEVYSSFDWKDG